MHQVIQLYIVTVICIFLGIETLGQNRWVQSYHDEIDAPIECITEYYDNGYLLSGKHGANYSKYNWLIKTDINGEILWEKTFGNGVNSIVFLDMAQDDSGNIYLGGGTRAYDPDNDPLIMKLDSCGNKEWCKVFHTENNYDFLSCFTLTLYDDIVIVLNYTNPEPWVERICLAKLSSTGDLIWKKCYTSSDTSLRNEDSFDIILTPDDGFLITGFCDYEDPEHPNLWWLKPYYLKVDSSGIFQWETVLYKETNQDGGIAWNTVVSPDGLYYYSSISHHHNDTNLRSCSLAKLDLQGNVIDVFDVIYGYEYGKLTYAQFLNDSILAAEAGWGNVEDSVWTTAVLLDTLGNLIDTRVLLYDMYTSILHVTYDGKLLYASNTYQNGQFDCYLTKLNQDLEQDTIYTMPFTYDSLCPYQIVSDTIVQDDCGLIVGIPEEEEKGRRGEVERMIELWPNPCSTVLSVSLASRQSSACPEERSEFGIVSRQSIESLTIQIYDVYGRLVKEELQSPYFNDGENEANWKIDVSNLPIGLYLVTVKDGQKVKVSGKFLVAR